MKLCLILLSVSLYAVTYQSAGFLRTVEAKTGVMSGVDIDQKGNIYILHRGDAPVAKFDSKGKYIKSWGAGMYRVPHVIKVAPDGTIWTTDNGNHVLRVFTPDGELLRTIGEVNVPGNDEKHFRSPDDIAWDSKGHLYVADAGNGRIVHFDAKGNFVSQWGKKGNLPGEFSTAHCIIIDKQDQIYVCDRGNKRLQVFANDGKFIAEWTGFGNPFGLAIVGKQMLSTEGDTNQMYLLEMGSGKIVEQWGKPDEFQLPHLMAVNRRGDVYLTEVKGGRIQILKRAPR